MILVPENKWLVKPGDKFGRLTVVGQPVWLRKKLLHKSEKRQYVVCKCECGNNWFGNVSYLTTHVTKSCGCLKRDTTSKRNAILKRKHQYNTQEYKALYAVFRNMMSRCHDKRSPQWKAYGGRKIRVAKYFHNFDVFAEWALSHGWKEGLTIDRINNDKGYMKSNIRFVTKTVNLNNTRRNVRVQYKGKTYTIAELSRHKDCKVSYSTLKYRMHKIKWDVFSAVTLPPISNNIIAKYMSDKTHYNITMCFLDYYKEYIQTNKAA